MPRSMRCGCRPKTSNQMENSVTDPSIEQLAEDQAKQGSELLAMQVMMTTLLKALGPTFAAPVFERSKNFLALMQNTATGPLGTGYVEDAILAMEQLEASVTGKPAPSGEKRFGTTTAFKLPRRNQPGSSVDRA